MPVACCLDRTRGLIRTTASGRVTAREVIQKKRSVEVAEASLSEGDLRELIDLSRVHSFDLGPNDFRRFVDIDSDRAARAGSLKIAFIAPDDLTYGMARMYWGLACRCEALEGDVFRSASEAWAFLGEEGGAVGSATSHDCIPVFRSN